MYETQNFNSELKMSSARNFLSLQANHSKLKGKADNQIICGGGGGKWWEHRLRMHDILYFSNGAGFFVFKSALYDFSLIGSAFASQRVWKSTPNKDSFSADLSSSVFLPPREEFGEGPLARFQNSGWRSSLPLLPQSTNQYLKNLIIGA